MYERSERPQLTDLRKALKRGDPQRVRALINSGADIRYKDECGYDAIIDAVHSRAVFRDPRLLDLLELLISCGVNLNGLSSYGESGLRVLSRIGRFDAVRLFLDAGADESHLDWTPLMRAVAIGSLADVRQVLDQSPNLEERDWWSRTAYLIAILTGEIPKAQLLRDRGADSAATGRCGEPPIFYAVEGHHTDMLRWLIQTGADVRQRDEYGSTSLIHAVEHDDLACVNVLLDAGADVHVYSHGTALSRARSRPIVMRLLAAGADPADANQRIVLRMPRSSIQPLTSVSRDDFQRARTRKFGNANPELMRVPFWQAMIRSGVSAYEASEQFGAATSAGDDQPVWCAQRFGQSLTLLPDGRAVQIAGEHEDSYDPDFCIYNDVFVHAPNGSITIYGYPKDVFPPTDFHTATLVGDVIYIMGSLGYAGTREYGHTPVYRLDTRTFQIDRLDTTGQPPGWIYKHRADLITPHEIRISGGKVVIRPEQRESHQPNPHTFVLDLNRLLWRCE